MRKNLILVLAALAVMTGCSKNEVLEGGNVPEQDKMQFMPIVGKQTRASEIVSSDLQVNGTEISLYGYKTPEVFGSRTTIAPFFTNDPEALTYNALWSTTKEYTWTELGAEYLSIFTYYSPKKILTGITAPTQADAAKFAYTVPNDINAQEDLLVASNLDMTKQSTKGIIAINFKHALSQLYFKAKVGATTYNAVIKSVKVLGAANASTFTYATAGAEAGTWAAATGSINYLYADKISQKITKVDVADRIADANGSLMLMPQAANTGFKFEVTYDVFDTAGNVIGANIVKSADMAELLMGKKYAYTLILPATPNDNIVFSVDVTEWDDASIATQREVRFDDYKLTDITADDQDAIAKLVADYNPTVIYLQKIKVIAPELVAALAIDLKPSATAVQGSKIILDCAIIDWKGNDITVTAPTGWTVSAAITADGEITITKD